ncbi:hypothetical protein AB0B50_04165 [Streptomyces sp. NPDC041068]|uniref:hypothetical protein n=1 Tax=Streptomyces sp. NPDC041068 TaxID=3155130 RepID=UPI003403DA70
MSPEVVAAVGALLSAAIAAVGVPAVYRQARAAHRAADAATEAARIGARAQHVQWRKNSQRTAWLAFLSAADALMDAAWTLYSRPEDGTLEAHTGEVNAARTALRAALGAAEAEGPARLTEAGRALGAKCSEYAALLENGATDHRARNLLTDRHDAEDEHPAMLGDSTAVETPATDATTALEEMCSLSETAAVFAPFDSPDGVAYRRAMLPLERAATAELARCEFLSDVDRGALLRWAANPHRDAFDTRVSEAASPFKAAREDLITAISEYLNSE